MIWTTQQDATLKSMWDKGHAMLEIGAHLGKSRNAVAGRIKRLGIQRKGNRKEIVLMVPRAVFIDPKEGKYVFSELEANQCRYPMGKMWCGHKTQPGCSWCAYHDVICHSSARTKISIPKERNVIPVEES